MYKEINMLTNLDIKKLKGVFATKEDIVGFSTKDDLKKFATKTDLKKFATKNDFKRFATKDDLKKFATKTDLSQLKGEFTASFDAIMHELKAIREELTVGSYRRFENSESIDDHEVRISRVENKLSF